MPTTPRMHWDREADRQTDTSPAGGEQVESDGGADDLLHVGADDRQLHHQPQEDPRRLAGRNDHCLLTRGSKKLMDAKMSHNSFFEMINACV